MTLSRSLDLNKQESIYEWVANTVDETGVDEETVWNIAEKLLLEPESMDGFINEIRLKVLYELHLNEWDGDEDHVPANWVKIAIPVDGEIENEFMFSFGSFNVPMTGDEERRKAMKAIAREEDLWVEVDQPGVLATRWEDRGPVWALRITKRILNEVYGLEFGDIQHAEEEKTDSQNLTWEDITDFR